MVVRVSVGLLVLWVACWSAIPALAKQETGMQENVTVLLFRTESVQHLRVRSRSASVRLCASCPEQLAPLLLDLQLRGHAMSDGSGRTFQTIQVRGDAEVVTDAGHHASAAGTWTVDVEDDRLRVRVQLTRERYTEAVLAAEAGPNEPAESLKALAVVARSFAAAAPVRHEGGALCDSTHCQALRLEPVPRSLRNAVWDTSNETMWFGSRQVPAYFSQHCGGFTQDAASVWGGSPLPWLSAHVDLWCQRLNAAWHASLAEPDVRRALTAEGILFARPIQEVKVLGRDRSGRVRQVQLREQDVTRTVSAATLRFALNRSLGWNQIRSDRFQVRRIGDRIVFEGSGFGHGVGLCQAGAAAMAQAGKSYHDILAAYFAGTAVRVQGNDAGWLVIPKPGFVLRTTTNDAALVDAASHAFTEARSIWGNTPTHFTVSVTVFPTTETFRLATGQPGWELATTQGGRIATQPIAVLRKQGDATAVLRHEFLHSFVEDQTSPAAPLWLREGMVAVLGGEGCDAHTNMSAEAVNAALHASASLSESQRAHAAACTLTKQFIAQHGMVAARQMLERP